MEEENQKYLNLEEEMALIHAENDTENDSDSGEGRLEIEENALYSQVVESYQELESTPEASDTTLAPFLANILHIPAHAPINGNQIMESGFTLRATSSNISSMPGSPEPPLSPIRSVPSLVWYAVPDNSIISPRHSSSIDTDIYNFSQESTPEVSQLMYDDLTIEDYSHSNEKEDKDNDVLPVQEAMSTSFAENEVMPETSSEIVSPSQAETVLLDDGREYRRWKKSVMLVYNRIISHRHASLFLKPVSEKKAPGYYNAVHRPMDLPTIRRNIRNGVIRTTDEFHRDVLLMFLNALMFNKRNGVVYNMAHEMLTASEQEIQVLKDAQKRAAAKREEQALELGLKPKSRDEVLTKKPRNE